MLKCTIVKIGGKVVDHSSQLNTFLQHFSCLPSPKILVHGGGTSATALADKLGVTATMINGRRITDAAMLEIATMVYGGLVNKKIVAQLQALGQNSLGLTGADLNMILAHKRPVGDIDYGFAGDIDEVNVAMLQLLLEQHIVPVFAPLTHNQQGQLLNTNADTIASTVAGSLAKRYDVTLMYCFERPGVLTDSDNDETVIPLLTPLSYRTLKTSGAIHNGMIPKLDNAFDALSQGVTQILIGNIEGVKMMHEEGFGGTRLLSSFL